MKITLDKQATKWFQDEVGVKAGDSVRFFGKYGGSSPIQHGFSLGVELTEPHQPIAEAKEDGITYFVEEIDAWYFDGHDLLVEYDETLQEPKYEYA
ncbi:HesB/YadR/YfhF family protein [Isobaculum melis]|uniref:Uncharacterized protein YneR n=1 Tax=Isobaculum melis TaxID=142588 RepID=A0A1H9S528_9LACT|nr:HesB/YadR/YfhF family protein [Isobaculum melis]SER80094.1 Uncharacterized protein YneR [Isobaculum melis]